MEKKKTLYAKPKKKKKKKKTRCVYWNNAEQFNGRISLHLVEAN